VRRALALSYVPRALWATGQAIADSTRIIEALDPGRARRPSED